MRQKLYENEADASKVRKRADLPAWAKSFVTAPEGVYVFDSVEAAAKHPASDDKNVT